MHFLIENKKVTVCTNLITGLFVAVCYDRAYEKTLICEVCLPRKKTFAFFKSPCLSILIRLYVCLSVQLQQASTLLHGKKARNVRGETGGHQVILVLVKSTQKNPFLLLLSLSFPFLSKQTEIQYDCRVPLFVYCASSEGKECPTFFTIFR